MAAVADSTLWEWGLWPFTFYGDSDSDGDCGGGGGALNTLCVNILRFDKEVESLCFNVFLFNNTVWYLMEMKYKVKSDPLKGGSLIL